MEVTFRVISIAKRHIWQPMKDIHSINPTVARWTRHSMGQRADMKGQANVLTD
jgi:hypothetical protein